jgi:SAM-dependent methyltransferase
MTSEPDRIACPACGVAYPIRLGVIDALAEPDPGVLRELEGLRREARMENVPLRDFAVRTVPHVQVFSEKVAEQPKTGMDYYGSCMRHFRQAMEMVRLPDRARVLEIGAEWDFYFLHELAELGCRCHAANIFFTIDERDDRAGRAAIRTLADMHRLPFADESFDAVLYSATLHHSPDLPRAVAEGARVLKRGGAFIAVNEPAAGWIKRTGRAGRDELIHENAYSRGAWLAAFRSAGLVGKPFFPGYYADRLSSGHTRGHRFSALGRIASASWKIQFLRRVMIWSASTWAGRLLGLQIDVVLRKP